ncbi:hypothetical protein GJAV_G00059770 [Gymnothorax javanicus]|nr:hypothetical protein GJAV_G00059770 [Gymnothorax javanicus]
MLKLAKWTLCAYGNWGTIFPVHEPSRHQNHGSDQAGTVPLDRLHVAPYSSVFLPAVFMPFRLRKTQRAHNVSDPGGGGGKDLAALQPRITRARSLSQDTVYERKEHTLDSSLIQCKNCTPSLDRGRNPHKKTTPKKSKKWPRPDSNPQQAGYEKSSFPSLHESSRNVRFSWLTSYTS